MSYIDSISQASTASNTTATSASSVTRDIMGKEDFLTLLVAQLQNQDPLNPSDPTEFTAQLAQFSSLEQLFNLNDSMKNMVTSNANADKFSTLQTIGKYVVYQDSKFEFDGEEAVQLGYQLDGTATEVQITIQQNGNTIAVINGDELSKGNHFVTWDGTTQSGTLAEKGSYTIAISAKATEGESIAASPLMKSEVTGVDLTGDYGGMLLTKAGKVSFTSILGVYEIPTAPADPPAEEAQSQQNTTETNTVSSAEKIPAKRSLLQAATDDVVSSITDKFGIKNDGQINLKVQY